MLLRLMDRVRRVRDERDSGVAMIVAVAAVAVLSLVAGSVVSMSVTSVGDTTSSRALNQSQAAADAAIDYGKVLLSAGTFNCTVPSLSGFTYTATIAYYDASNAALTCTSPATLSGVPAKAVITSTGKAQAKGVAGVSNGDTFTRIAIFTIVIVSSRYTLDKSVFSDAGQTLTNNTTLAGTNANVYTNGSYQCSTSSGINGDVYSQGDITTSNTCIVKGKVWTGGNFAATSSVSISGDLYAVGSTSLDNSVWVGGSVVGNNAITISNQGQAACPTGGVTAKVCGNVVSFNGGVTFNNSPIVAGGVYAKGAVSLGVVNGTKMIGGNLVSSTGSVTASNSSSTIVGGYVATGGQVSLSNSHSGTAWAGNTASTCMGSGSGLPTTYPSCNPTPPTIPTSAIPAALNYPTNSQVVAPPKESLPLLPMNPTSGTLAALWPGWTIQAATCANYDSLIDNQTEPKLLLVVTCAGGIQWNNRTMSLKGDLAIMSPTGFSSQNQLNVKSSVTGTARNFMLIVPSDSPGVTWTHPVASDPTYASPTCASPAGNISMSNNTTFTSVNTFMYTPCSLTLANNWSGFQGQIYAGKVTQLPQNATMTMMQMNVPGVQSQNAVSASITVTETARFDKRA